MVLDATDIPDELRGVVDDVRVEQLQGGRTAIDFHLYPLQRDSVASNFVFTGTRFRGGLVRLPRVSKDKYTEQEVRDSIWGALPFTEGVSLRLEPEIDGLVSDADMYWYLHVEIDAGIGAENAAAVVRALAKNYKPL